MRVKCLYNKGIDLPKDMFSEKYRPEDYTSPLKIAKDYTVYAMTIKDGYVWYYLCINQNFYNPVWSPSPLFEIIDGRLSRYWIFSYIKGINYYKAQAIWAYPEWANDPDYYDNLTDGEEREVNLFKNYREKMDLEFPDSSVFEIAGTGDREWLICPFCIDAWQHPSDEDALVRCPKCRNILNNPRYKNTWPHL